MADKKIVECNSLQAVLDVLTATEQAGWTQTYVGKHYTKEALIRDLSAIRDAGEEIVELLREERSERLAHAYEDRNLACSKCGDDYSAEWSAQVHERQVERIDALIDKLGGYDGDDERNT